MGDYTGLRFKGIIKKRYRKEIKILIDNINNEEKYWREKWSWGNSNERVLKEFSRIDRNHMIPNGMIAYYLPGDWILRKENTENKLGRDIGLNGFDLEFDEKSGYLAFQCSLKNQQCEVTGEYPIEFFVKKVVPKIVYRIIHLETYFEHDKYSDFFKLNNKEIYCSTGIKYESDDYDSYWYGEEIEKDPNDIEYSEFPFSQEYYIGNLYKKYAKKRGMK